MADVIGQWTTPTTTFVVKDALFTQATSIVVTFKQRDYMFDKTDVTVTDNTHISVTLTQAETGKFIKGMVEVQINWVYQGDKRAMTYIVKVPVEENLKDVVL